MINNSITTLYYVGSNGIHFQKQEYNKTHASKMERLFQHGRSVG